MQRRRVQGGGTDRPRALFLSQTNHQEKTAHLVRLTPLLLHLQLQRAHRGNVKGGGALGRLRRRAAASPAPQLRGRERGGGKRTDSVWGEGGRKERCLMQEACGSANAAEHMLAYASSACYPYPTRTQPETGLARPGQLLQAKHTKHSAWHACRYAERPICGKPRTNQQLTRPPGGRPRLGLRGRNMESMSAGAGRLGHAGGPPPPPPSPSAEPPRCGAAAARAAAGAAAAPAVPADCGRLDGALLLPPCCRCEGASAAGRGRKWWWGLALPAAAPAGPAPPVSPRSLLSRSLFRYTSCGALKAQHSAGKYMNEHTNERTHE